MSLQLKTEEVRSVAGTALTGTLANVGSPIESPARTVMILNGCDDQVLVSWDGGTTNGFDLPASSAVAIDCAISPNENNAKPYLAVGSQFQAKHDGAAPTTGKLSITVIV
tara:strand:- start:1137 stop:1466 length:330 start_codon:yes stop_codon:yes gene_type:complete